MKLSKSNMRRIFPLALLLASQGVLSAGPFYTYKSELSVDNDLCGHMLNVFNKKFRDLWFYGDYQDEKRFSQDGEFAFKRLPGITHDNAVTAKIIYSKIPSSPEFDAIDWREGRYIIGGPSGIEIPYRRLPQPMLIAYFDYNNDGQEDTVIKHGFSSGYYKMAHGGILSEEYISVLFGRRLEVNKTISLWDLRGKGEGDKKLIDIINASYVRPFIYQMNTYFAKYEMDLGKNYDAAHKPPYKPKKETMSIIFFGRINEGHNQKNSDNQNYTEICRFGMKQVAK